MDAIGEVEIIFLLLLLFIVVFGLLAKRLGTPYPIVMVIGGLLLGFVPGIPQVTLNPDLVFLVVLPPLLYAAAWTTSWRDFRYNLINICFLAFGLVAFTVVAVALVAPEVLDGFDWRLGLVLGAIVAPTDAIAATSIARRVGLPARIVDILEGESLINDATGLLALQFATAIVVYNRVPAISTGLLTFIWLTAGGIGVGLLSGWIVDQIERRINDGPIEITLSIMVPYVVYLGAERVHGSGVLAVVACGLLLSRRSAEFFSPSVRIQVWSVWESLNYVLNGLIFVLIGLQLPFIRMATRGYGSARLLADGLMFSAVVILLRLIWVFPAAAIAFRLNKLSTHSRERPPRLSNIFVVGWTGMRGVVSLSAALALPVSLANGSPFPQRTVIIFLTFFVILVTLVLQGLTLPRVIRALGLAGATGPNCEEQEARRILIEAAVSHLEDAKSKDSADYAGIYDDLTGHYLHSLASVQPQKDSEARANHHYRHVQLSLEALRVERATAIRLRDEGRISDEVLRRIERDLDLNESRLASTGEL